MVCLFFSPSGPSGKMPYHVLLKISTGFHFSVSSVEYFLVPEVLELISLHFRH